MVQNLTRKTGPQANLKESQADKALRLKKILQQLGEKLEKEAEMLKHDGITPVLIFEDGQFRIVYMTGEFIAENEISYDDMETFARVKRTTRKGLENDEDTDELDDLRIEKQKARTSVLKEAGYSQQAANVKTQQRLNSAVDNVLKAEKLIGNESSLKKYEDANAGKKRPAKEASFLRGILEKKIKILQEQIRKDSKEEDVARIAASLHFDYLQEIIAARALSLGKDMSKKILGNSIQRKKENHIQVLQDIAAFVENGRKDETAAAKAAAIEKVLKDLEVFEINPMVDLWTDRNLQREKLEKITDIRKTNKSNHYLEILEAEMQSLALCIFDRSLGSDYDAAGLELDARERIEKEVDDFFKRKEEKKEEFSSKEISDMKQRKKNEAMYSLAVTEDQWTNGSMIGVILARMKAKDQNKMKATKAAIIKEITERRMRLSDESREALLGTCSGNVRVVERRGSENFFLPKEEKKERKKQGPKGLAPGFSCPESMEIFKKIKAASKAILKNGAPPEIKRELAMAPMKIGSEKLRNKALIFVLSTFAAVAAEQDEELDDW